MTPGKANKSAGDISSAEPSDTPLTDVLLDQFAAYYVLAVLAVTALEESRRRRLEKSATAQPDPSGHRK
ncbi:MAG: hypothetical protein VXY86_08300 [Pseudomonadota bacterium]|nr:hypothetical protein [Pseudomonadota bacterium]